MSFPAQSDASRDHALKGTPHTVYLWLTWNLLDLEAYRAIKIEGLALAVDLDEKTVSRAVRLLVGRGYLERRYVARGGYTYRLRFARQAA